MSATAAPASEEGDVRRAEIERLERQIDSRTGAVPNAEGPAPGPPGIARPQGEDAERTCEQACQASTSICQAAARICSLADDIDDDWARGKCRRASRTCTDVRRRSVNACGTC